jgi:hypothetical protein
MTKLSDKFKRATAVILVMPGGRRKQLAETERHAAAHALEGGLANWEQRCAALYQVIGYMAHEFDVFDHDDVIKALDVAVGRGDVEKLLPWPSTPLQQDSPCSTYPDCGCSESTFKNCRTVQSAINPQAERVSLQTALSAYCPTRHTDCNATCADCPFK